MTAADRWRYRSYLPWTAERRRWLQTCAFVDSVELRMTEVIGRSAEAPHFTLCRNPEILRIAEDTMRAILVALAGIEDRGLDGDDVVALLTELLPPEVDPAVLYPPIERS